MLEKLNANDKKRFTRLLSEMIYLISDLNIVLVDDSLIEEYLYNVEKIDDKNPIKDLLLLNKSFIDHYVEFHSKPSFDLTDHMI